MVRGERKGTEEDREPTCRMSAQGKKRKSAEEKLFDKRIDEGDIDCDIKEIRFVDTDGIIQYVSDIREIEKGSDGEVGKHDQSIQSDAQQKRGL
jgi:hypothetical protein